MRGSAEWREKKPHTYHCPLYYMCCIVNVVFVKGVEKNSKITAGSVDFELMKNLTNLNELIQLITNPTTNSSIKPHPDLLTNKQQPTRLNTTNLLPPKQSTNEPVN